MLKAIPALDERRGHSMDSGLRRNDAVGGRMWCQILAQIHPTHRISLGPDPRAFPNTAQAASGPRVEPEGERWVG